MMGGGATLLIWMMTRAEFLLVVGAAFLLLVPLCIVIGFMSLRRNQLSPPHHIRTMALLLLANIPIAAAAVYAADAFYCSFTVVIVNRSDEPLHNLYVVAGGDTAQKRRLDPGDFFRVRLYPDGNSSPLVSCLDSSGERSISVDHYLTGMDDGHMKVLVLDEGHELEFRPIALRLFEAH